GERGGRGRGARGGRVRERDRPRPRGGAGGPRWRGRSCGRRGRWVAVAGADASGQQERDQRESDDRGPEHEARPVDGAASGPGTAFSSGLDVHTRVTHGAPVRFGPPAPVLPALPRSPSGARFLRLAALLQEPLERLQVRGGPGAVVALDPHDRQGGAVGEVDRGDRKSTRLNSSHVKISYAVFCLKKKTPLDSMRS